MARVAILPDLATMPTNAESVPVNTLFETKASSLEDPGPVPARDMRRMISTEWIVMPRSEVQLSAGRVSLQPKERAMWFIAGANSIFNGHNLLTAPINEVDEHEKLFQKLGLSGRTRSSRRRSTKRTMRGREQKRS